MKKDWMLTHDHVVFRILPLSVRLNWASNLICLFQFLSVKSREKGCSLREVIVEGNETLPNYISVYYSVHKTLYLLCTYSFIYVSLGTIPSSGNSTKNILFFCTLNKCLFHFWLLFIIVLRETKPSCAIFKYDASIVISNINPLEINGKILQVRKQCGRVTMWQSWKGWTRDLLLRLVHCTVL